MNINRELFFLLYYPVDILLSVEIALTYIRSNINVLQNIDSIQKNYPSPMLVIPQVIWFDWDTFTNIYMIHSLPTADW